MKGGGKGLHWQESTLLETLQGYVRSTGDLTPRPDPPEWVQVLSGAFFEDPGLLALCGASGLSEHLAGEPGKLASSIPVKPCAADDLLLWLVGRAVERGVHLGIALPPGVVMMPLLAICKTLLGDFLGEQDNVHLADHRSIRARGGIMLVSPDIEVRTRYFNMRVQTAKIEAVYPACRIGRHGSITAYGTEPGEQEPSVCFFLAGERILPDPVSLQFRPAVVLLDFTHDRWMDRLGTIIDWCRSLRDRNGVPANFLALLPVGDRVTADALAERGTSVFQMDTGTVAQIVEQFEPVSLPADELARTAYSAWSFAELASEDPLDRMYTVYRIPDEVASDVLAIAGQINSLLQLKELRGTRDVRLATWLLGTLLQLPVPPEWYEQTAYVMGNRQRLSNLIAGIGRRGDDGTDDAVAQSFRGHLEMLYQRLNVANPKSEAFLQYCREQIIPDLSVGKTVMVLARNDVVARALGPWLQSQGIDLDGSLLIRPFRAIDGRTNVDRAVTTGYWPARYRWQIGGRLARALDLLLYAPEEEPIKRQLSAFYGARARERADMSRMAVLDRLGLRSATPPRSSPRAVPAITTPHPVPVATDLPADGSDAEDESVDEGVRSLFDEHIIDVSSFHAPVQTAPPPIEPMQLREDLDPGEDIDDVERGNHIPTSGTVRIPCRMLTVRQVGEDEMRYTYLSLTSWSDCFLPGNADDLVRMQNADLEPGAILIGTNEADRDSLFDRVLQISDAQPTMKYLKSFRQYWLDAINALAQLYTAPGGGLAYQRLHRDLQRSGADVGYAAVRQWIAGDTIGPRDLSSIVAVGTLSHHPMLTQHVQQVDRAFRQIRTMHQVLGRRINSALERAGGAARSSRSGSDKQFRLDPAIAVQLDELLDALEYWEVLDVSAETVLVPSSRVGDPLPTPVYGGL